MSGKTEFEKFMDRTPKLQKGCMITSWYIDEWGLQTLVETLEQVNPPETRNGLRLLDTYVAINPDDLELEVYTYYEETDRDHLLRCKQLWHEEEERLEMLSEAAEKKHQRHLELIKETEMKQLKALAKKYDVKIDHGL